MGRRECNFGHGLYFFNDLNKVFASSPNHLSRSFSDSPDCAIIANVELIKSSHSLSPFLTPRLYGAPRNGFKPAFLNPDFLKEDWNRFRKISKLKRSDEIHMKRAAISRMNCAMSNATIAQRKPRNQRI